MPDADVVVWRYATKQGVFVAVINTGLGPEEKMVTLDVGVLGGETLRDLVTGERVRARNGAIALQLPPVCTTSWRVQ